MFDNNIKILVIDDMMTIRKIVKKTLGDMNYKNIVEAVDGVNAWDVLSKDKSINLVLSDWNMPNMTGLELLVKIRADAYYKTIPFIFLTAEADIAQVKQAITSGADNYVLKPFSLESLKTKMTETYSKVKTRIAA